VAELPTDAARQRCYVHFLRNALDHLPRKADDGGLPELRWIYERHKRAAQPEGGANRPLGVPRALGTAPSEAHRLGPRSTSAGR